MTSLSLSISHSKLDYKLIIKNFSCAYDDDDDDNYKHDYDYEIQAFPFLLLSLQAKLDNFQQNCQLQTAANSSSITLLEFRLNCCSRFE